MNSRAPRSPGQWSPTVSTIVARSTARSACSVVMPRPPRTRRARHRQASPRKPKLGATVRMMRWTLTSVSIASAHNMIAMIPGRISAPHGTTYSLITNRSLSQLSRGWSNSLTVSSRPERSTDGTDDRDDRRRIARALEEHEEQDQPDRIATGVLVDERLHEDEEHQPRGRHSARIKPGERDAQPAEQARENYIGLDEDDAPSTSSCDMRSRTGY